MNAAAGELELALEFEACAAVVCLFGPSGSGKTSCLEHIAGVRRPVSGRIALGDVVLYDSAAGIDLSPAARRLGWIPQDGLLFPHLDVRRNLLFGHRPGGLTLEQAARLLEIEHLIDRRVRGLSGGEARRVALGRALLAHPRLILADEPFAGLDRPLRRRLMPLFRRVVDELGIGMLLVSHSPAEVRALADQVVSIERGRVVAVTTPEALIAPEAEPINLLHGRLIESGLVELVGGARIVAPTGERAPGSALRLELPASAVVLGAAPVEKSSIRNRLPGRVDALASQGDLLLVTLDVGCRLLASVTPAAAEELGLAPGGEIQVLFKATALRVV